MNLLQKNKEKKDNSVTTQQTNLKQNINNKIEFFKIINDITLNKTVQEMKKYRHHFNTSCYEHCIRVAYYSYWIAKKLGLDYISTARAAMLHDLFLYDWRKSHTEVKLDELHAFVHPKIALKNATEIFDLNKKEKDIIVKHMWPVTFAFPKYIETYIVSFMDKYSACKESYTYFQSQLKKNRIYKYAYVFLSLIIFRIV